jgi:DNA polymerase elongation subunit (family B)
VEAPLKKNLISLPAVNLSQRKLSVLDFDVETLAAGFADPAWVPQKVMCVSWSWTDSEDVEVRVCGPMGFFKPELRRSMVAELLEQINRADIVTGHNLIRFDLPILNSECLRLGLPPMKSVAVQDTMRIVKTKGFKKGQDNIGKLLETAEQKLSLDWQGWEEAYEQDGWETIKARCVSDVVMHKQMRLQMLERGWLKKATVWSP